MIYYATVLAISLCAYFVLVPLDSSIFEYGKRMNDPLSASTYRNVAFMLTNVILYGTLALFLHVFDPGFSITIASMLVLAALYVLPAKLIFRKI